MSSRREPCPECDRGPRDRALSVAAGDLGEVFFCHRCGYHGVILDGDRHGDWQDERRRDVQRVSNADRPAEVLHAIWSRTVELHGTLGEKYLTHRRCVIPPHDSDLRYLRSSERYPPSLCALVTDAISNAPMTLHFTRLAADGLGKADDDSKRYLGGHPKKGGVIRLWPDSDVTYGLGIAEGIETALSAAHGFAPMWATCDAGNMAALPVLAIESLTIFADNDEAGLSAARTCGGRWASAGHEVRLVIPTAKDFNDVVRNAA